MSATSTTGDGTGTIKWLHGNSSGEIIDAWHPEIEADEGADDSDKTFTVSANEEWEVLSIWVELTTDASAGDRQLVVEFQDDAADVIGQVRAGAVQAASNTYYYQFAPNVIDLTAVRDSDYLSTPIPRMILPASYIVRIYDNNAVSAAGDDMVCQMLANVRSVPS
jgi:hypothetical protein